MTVQLSSRPVSREEYQEAKTTVRACLLGGLAAVIFGGVIVVTSLMADDSPLGITYVGLVVGVVGGILVSISTAAIGVYLGLRLAARPDA